MMTPIEIAQVVHEANRAYCQTIGDHSQVVWNDAPAWQRESAVNGVEGILNGTITRPEQSHESWLFRVGVLDRTVFPARSHPCFVPYAELPPEQQVKDAIFFAIVNACKEYA